MKKVVYIKPTVEVVENLIWEMILAGSPPVKGGVTVEKPNEDEEDTDLNG